MEEWIIPPAGQRGKSETCYSCSQLSLEMNKQVFHPNPCKILKVLIYFPSENVSVQMSDHPFVYMETVHAKFVIAKVYLQFQLTGLVWVTCKKKVIGFGQVRKMLLSIQTGGLGNQIILAKMKIVCQFIQTTYGMIMPVLNCFTISVKSMMSEFHCLIIFVHVLHVIVL